MAARNFAIIRARKPVLCHAVGTTFPADREGVFGAMHRSANWPSLASCAAVMNPPNVRGFIPQYAFMLPNIILKIARAHGVNTP